ncbi:pyridoxal phosphate-dependent aminotransferase [Saccharolobus islandicus]|uniref:Aminotransferase n=3 Tax=Saccharolobus islandicus TaxID=43080 RepID=C4KH49_SACI6|nr:pyridoxal phosphate-dependent aminotransferase [Sulfolobus islandicus]ACP38079.1 aminotransferase class I and II [Sulfolobus islandicus M.14.25]ACP55258.1 aminotransferase class I and II [Sulfolobus islandicus M.16.27]ACR41913.1 aminotransferase class I and II [Sulfolobus islandicus M.16.4]
MVSLLDFNENMSQVTGETTLLYKEIARNVEKTKKIKIIDFGIGQPDLPTFKRIRDAAKEALDQGFTFYTSAFGIDELREKISQYLNTRYGADVRKEEVIVTPGAKPALFLVFILYINPGDEVILPDPSFYSYAEVVKLLGGKPIYTNLKWSKEGFSIDVDDLQSKISKRTKMIVFNNPHNPTGTLFSPNDVKKIVDISRDNKIILLSDEIYDNFVYEGKMRSTLEDSDWRDFLIYVNGFSKTFSMTGWRLGYIVAKREIIQKMGVLAANIYTAPTSFVQKAAVKAFDTFDEVNEMVKLFKKRRDVMYDQLIKVKGIEVSKPNGAFYMFPNAGKLLKISGLDVKSFAIRLIEEKGVVTIPGEVFPLNIGKEFLRLSFAVNEEVIREGVQKIREFAEQMMNSR